MVTERAGETIGKVVDRYFPDYLLPPGRGDERYDPLVTAIHHATDAIGRLDTWIQHVKEVGPHDTKKCHKCMKLFCLAHDALQLAGHRVSEGYNFQFVHCKREGCGNMFRPIRTRDYCSHACRQAAYRARKAQDGKVALPADTVPYGEPWPEPWRDVAGIKVHAEARPDQLGPLDHLPAELPGTHEATRT